MNKFLKKAVLVVMMILCLTIMTGCGDGLDMLTEVFIQGSSDMADTVDTAEHDAEDENEGDAMHDATVHHDDMPDYGAYDNDIDQNTPLPKGVGYIFVGDSRTAGLELLMPVKDREYFVCESGQGSYWFEKYGYKAALEIIRDNPGVKFKVFYNLGVNDLNKIDEYIPMLNRFITECAAYDARVYFVSVNPVNDGRCRNVQNADIEVFNSRLQSEVEFDGYIDTYSAMFYELMGSTDRAGLHYPNEMYLAIYKFIRYTVE